MRVFGFSLTVGQHFLFERLRASRFLCVRSSASHVMWWFRLLQASPHSRRPRGVLPARSNLGATDVAPGYAYLGHAALQLVGAYVARPPACPAAPVCPACPACPSPCGQEREAEGRRAESSSSWFWTAVGVAAGAALLGYSAGRFARLGRARAAAVTGPPEPVFDVVAPARAQRGIRG